MPVALEDGARREARGGAGRERSRDEVRLVADDVVRAEQREDHLAIELALVVRVEHHVRDEARHL